MNVNIVLSRLSLANPKFAITERVMSNTGSKAIKKLIDDGGRSFSFFSISETTISSDYPGGGKGPAIITVGMAIAIPYMSVIPVLA